MTKSIYVNLPVADLVAATRFYEALGCTKNPRFSDENAASMVWSEGINFQLLTREYFSTFISKPVADARRSCEVLLALSSDTREGVDKTVEAGADGGGRADVRERMDLGWLYNRTVEDPDGHVIEVIWVDVTGMPGA